MAQDGAANRSPLRTILSIIIIIIIPLLIGLYIAPRIVPAPKIGIIRLYYEINPATAFEFREQLDYARNDPSIDAVVLVVNSPGGTASDSENLYMEVLDARNDFPVVTSIDFLAASGAYYIAAATDAIYAKPGSAVGSIGVISSLPDTVFIEEDILTTGPYKSFGGTRDGFARRTETLKFAFLSAVEAGRGEKLQTELDFLSRAEIYDGVLAEEMGLIDGMRSTSEAIAEAGRLAGLRDYEVVELYPLTFTDDETSGTAVSTYQAPPVDTERLWAVPSDLAPGFYYRYMELPTN